ncbi:MAG: 2-oxoacid:acceptor oxidoreductase family protein [Eubacteriales bacterium]|nr:2-oxoacid:acceptor oxidoreductase family protein [Eubacteriales bacterium]
MKEIIFYGRGGQGAVTASKWLVSAAVFEQKHAHALPAFGQERQGAPVYAYARIDVQPIATKSFVYKPDCAVVFDNHLPALGVDYSAGIKGDKILVINSQTEIDPQIASAFSVVGRVDATGITGDILGRVPANAAMLGALAATTNWISIDSVILALKRSMPGRMGELNAKAAQEAFSVTAVTRSK